MTDPVVKITFGGTEILLPSTGRVLKLYKEITQNSNASFELDGVDYIVPTGKKFWILYMTMQQSLGALPVIISKHTVADTAGGTQIDRMYTGTTAEEQSKSFISVEAAKYINGNQTVAGTVYMNIYGVELNV